MSQRTSGLRSILGLPAVYDGFQAVLGARKFRRIYIADYVQPHSHAAILDIGCGTAEILDFLPVSASYTGYDASPRYIDAAQRRYGDRASFHCALVDTMNLPNAGGFDVVMANGLMHHLDDSEVLQLAETAFAALRPGGRFVTHDPCFAETQSAFAKYMVSRDRGQNVRSLSGYLGLLAASFPASDGDVRHDMAYIPYTHALTVSIKPGAVE